MKVDATQEEVSKFYPVKLARFYVECPWCAEMMTVTLFPTVSPTVIRACCSRHHETTFEWPGMAWGSSE